MDRDLRPAIGVLRQLQELDQRIWELKRRQAELPEQLAAVQQARDAQAERTADAEARMKAIQLQQKSKEMELGSKEEAIKKAQVQLYQVKTNKEYTALQHEIEGFKADRSVLEDDILAMMDGIEAASRATNQQRDALHQAEETLRATKARLDGEAHEMDRQLAGLAAQRQQLVPQVTANILGVYERVLENRQGLALVPMDGEACGGCHMILPPQVIHEVRMAEKLIRCDNCTRLLYWIEDAS